MPTLGIQCSDYRLKKVKLKIIPPTIYLLPRYQQECYVYLATLKWCSLSNSYSCALKTCLPPSRGWEASFPCSMRKCCVCCSLGTPLGGGVHPHHWLETTCRHISAMGSLGTQSRCFWCLKTALIHSEGAQVIWRRDHWVGISRMEGS